MDQNYNLISPRGGNLLAKLRLALFGVLSITAVACKTTMNSSLQNRSTSSAQTADSCLFDFDLLEPSTINSPYSTDLPNNITPIDWQIMIRAAYLSRLAYETPSDIKRRLSKAGFRHSSVIIDENMMVIIATRSQCTYVAFRGTDMTSLKDWMVDATSSTRRVPSGKIHKGFYRAYQSLHKKISRVLKRNHAPKNSLIITGHSLGGALAGVYGYYNDLDRFLEQKGSPISKIITFGQPLFADLNLAIKLNREFEERYFRFVNDRDVVTRVPPWFVHFGHLVWLKDSKIDFPTKRLVYGSPGDVDDELPRIPNELKATKEAYEEFLNQTTSQSHSSPESVEQPVGFGISDHSMKFYLSRMMDARN
jgi:triacylglycerol lipase